MHTPRAYFERHFHNDPWLSLEGIRVAVDHERDDRIASTVRVFVRRALIDGRHVPCGGIGEVSTKADYRKRGLASQLLQDAEKWMKEQGMAFGMLHTRSAAPLYKSLGWHPIPMRYSVISAPLTSFTTPPQGKYHYNNIADHMQSVVEVHEAYARHFNGTFVRDDAAYWDKWIAYEFTREATFSAIALDPATGQAGGYAVAFVKYDPEAATTADDQREAGRRGAITVRVREFGVIDEVMADDGGQALLGSLVGELLRHFINDSDNNGGFSGGTDDDGSRRVRLVYPAAIENYFALGGDALVVPDAQREESVVDEGTMTRVLDHPTTAGSEVRLEQSLRQQPTATPFSKAQQPPRSSSYLLFWETDGF